jgi:uncharacterized membrane protein YhiD involved in acid resistance
MDGGTGMEIGIGIVFLLIVMIIITLLCRSVVKSKDKEIKELSSQVEHFYILSKKNKERHNKSKKEPRE